MVTQYFSYMSTPSALALLRNGLYTAPLGADGLARLRVNASIIPPNRIIYIDYSYHKMIR